MALPLLQVDAFTDVPFTGNPAAVCLLPPSGSNIHIDEITMQKIASEMNLSETAFVQPVEGHTFESGECFHLRWFTPTTEVPLCGHATLATAAAIRHRYQNMGTLRFQTLSGELVTKTDAMVDCAIAMDFPLNPPEPRDISEVRSLLDAVIGELAVLALLYSESTKKLLVRLDDSVTMAQLQAIQPSFSKMLAFDQSNTTKPVKGVIVCLKGPDNSPYDFVSRYFAPWVGIDEDPVTGSAHTVSAPYWSKQLNKTVMTARQCSPRGGDVFIQLQQETSRVLLSGKAVVVVEGQLFVKL
eukprot:GILJ01010169.1.p1 GENE.GILJ01010169.1~~GILJ01010169.1.p1  ORF type:complete len:308 (+),score=33.32 GILJ01010169.1:32-925(+)